MIGIFSLIGLVVGADAVYKAVKLDPIEVL